MKALITGGAGFIGSHLARKLLKKRHRVSVVDNLSTGTIDNISDLKKNKNFRFYMDTILNRRIMKNLISKADIVYHLAAAVGVKYIIDNPLESLETNIRGTEAVLELANKLGKKKVILASTSEIYGKNTSHKYSFRETDDRVLGSTMITRWSYSCSKALDEFLALAYYREKKLPVVILRYFNTCGPGQTGRYGMVIPRFVRQAAMGQPITVFGDGKQTRCFTHVYDTVEATFRLSLNRRAEGEVFNVGRSRAVSINYLAKKIKEMLGSGSKIVHVPYERAYEKGFEDMRHRKPDVTKLRKFTGFRPNFKVDDILKDVINYFEE